MSWLELSTLLEPQDLCLQCSMSSLQWTIHFILLGQRFLKSYHILKSYLLSNLKYKTEKALL